jgi:hypothetical protein
MQKWIVYFFLCLSLFINAPAFSSASYSKRINLPPLHTTFAELQEILNKAHTLMSQANGKEATILVEEITIKKEELEVKLSGHQLNNVSTKIPSTIDRFEYTIMARNAPAIRDISLEFYDYERRLSVEGSSPEQVDAIFTMLRDNLTKSSNAFAGNGFRFFLWVVVVISIAFIPPLFKEFPNLRRLLVFISVIAFIILILLLFYAEIFSGFYAVQGNISFLEKYAPQIGFIGLFFSVLAYFFPVQASKK